MKNKYSGSYGRICCVFALFAIVFSEVRIFPLLFGVSVIIVSILNIIYLRKEEARYTLNLCIYVLLIAAGVYVIIDAENLLTSFLG